MPSRTDPHPHTTCFGGCSPPRNHTVAISGHFQSAVPPRASACAKPPSTKDNCRAVPCRALPCRAGGSRDTGAAAHHSRARGERGGWGHLSRARGPGQHGPGPIQLSAMRRRLPAQQDDDAGRAAARRHRDVFTLHWPFSVKTKQDRKCAAFLTKTSHSLLQIKFHSLVWWWFVFFLTRIT